VSLAGLMNTYLRRRGLASLPRLIRRQRRLEKRVARYEAAVALEKATRDAIDALLLKQGLKHGEGLTCLGYDVVHNERAGQRRISADKLRAQGVAEIDIAWATETGKPSLYATVRPMKGINVQAVAA
jgi:uncharacterized small protein (DUF1192 family)